MQASTSNANMNRNNNTSKQPAAKRTKTTMGNKKKLNTGIHKRSKAAKPASPRRASAEAVPRVTMLDDDKPDDCLICCEPIRVYALGSCNHRNVCATCCLRRRKLYDENDCCICKQKQEQVIFTASRLAPFAGFDRDLLASLPQLPGVFFDDEENKASVLKLFSLHCPICADQDFNSIWTFKEHLKKHQLHFWYVVNPLSAFANC